MTIFRLKSDLNFLNILKSKIAQVLEAQDFRSKFHFTSQVLFEKSFEVEDVSHVQRRLRLDPLFVKKFVCKITCFPDFSTEIACF